MKQQLTLKQIRLALEKADAQRLDPALSDAERAAFEQTALTLRAAERSAIQDLEKDLIKDFEQETKELSLQAKQIRATVTKLNKVTKVMDKTQDVVKECVKVLKAIATYTLVLTMLLLTAQCSTISKSQLNSINSIATMSDSLSKVPVRIFTTLDGVREQRNLMYTASIQNVDNRIAELNDIAKYASAQDNLAARSAVYAKVLSSYMNALKSLSLPARYSSYGTQLRGIGRNVDSLLIAYNKLEWSDQVQNIGLSKKIGQTSGYLASETTRRLQRKLVKNVLLSGDSLVAQCCDALIEMLKTQQLQQLIENEEQGLESNYRSYLMAMQLAARESDMSFDRIYLEQKQALASVKSLRTKGTNALRSIKNAHHHLLENIDKCRTYDELFDDLQDLTAQLVLLDDYLL